MNVDFQRRVDRLVGVPICRALSLLPGARNQATNAGRPRKILVILLSEMGSLVLARPMFERLRSLYPEASLHALVFRQNRELLDLLGVVPDENVITLANTSFSALVSDGARALRELRRLEIDTVIDCELFSRVSAILSLLSGATIRVGFHRHKQEGLYRGDFINRPVAYNPYQHIARQFVSLAEAIDSKGVPRVKRPTAKDDVRVAPLELRDGELEAMRDRFRRDFPEASGKPLVLLYPGGGLLPIRAWPIASFQTLAADLVGRGFAVGVIGLASDKPLARQMNDALPSAQILDLTGYTKTVRELMLVFHFAELLVTNDGGPGHFAAMTPIRTILLFGPETPVLYGSLDPSAVQLFQNLSCSPCLTAYNHRDSPCDGDNQCLKTIEPDVVLRHAVDLLAGERRTTSV